MKGTYEITNVKGQWSAVITIQTPVYKSRGGLWNAIRKIKSFANLRSVKHAN